MSPAQTAIPYEKQFDTAPRACGAACLAMVYRSLGQAVSQDEIWPAIAKPNRAGSVSSTTYLMVRDALTRGFHAVAIQARHPLQALRICRHQRLRAILNHRVRRDSPAGHYSVLVQIDEQNVVLHDPLLGPSRRLAFSELLELWLPAFPNSEIAGNVLIAVSAAQANPQAACAVCGSPITPAVDCPRCGKAVALEPAAVLGCSKDACIGRMWNSVCCPWCDAMWSPGRSAAADENAVSGPNLDQFYAAIGRFRDQVLSIPAAAAHPDVINQLDFITASKEKFQLAYAEQLAHISMRRAQLSAMAEEADRKAEVQRKMLEDMAKPAPPLDGNALGRALLKNLGFIA